MHLKHSEMCLIPTAKKKENLIMGYKLHQTTRGSIQIFDQKHVLLSQEKRIIKIQYMLNTIIY